MRFRDLGNHILWQEFPMIGNLTMALTWKSHGVAIAGPAQSHGNGRVTAIDLHEIMASGTAMGLPMAF